VRFRFPIFDFPPEAEALRAEVRTFIADELAAGLWKPGGDFASHYDATFSRRLGARGWLGMTWPRRYGGHERSMLERLAVSAATDAALELSLQYVQDRKQFGQALAKFQVIQHSLALAAEEVAACGAISDLALTCAARDGMLGARMSALLDAAAVVAGRCVDVIYDVCHQVHGAIGFTQEYPLHRHSIDLLRWRDHVHSLRGGEIRCAERLGDSALETGSAWRTVTSLMKSSPVDD
jgi:alkylation response protein AidB-like acyl-CoA dehydrogenase